MRFKGLDLNLLAAFDTLMETRSVSRAAEQMNLSQPAMSAALARLREYFADDLLAVQGKRMFPTAYAETLTPLVRESLRRIEDLIATSSSFDPATSQRTFRIVASDYVVAAVIAPFMQRLAEIAPLVHVETVSPGEDSGELLTHGKVDLCLMPQGFTDRAHPSELLYEERFVVVGWRDNPVFAEGLSEKTMMASGHVAILIGIERTPVFADREMERLGRERRIEVIASSFTIVPWFLIGTQRLTMMHERLARRMCAHFPLTYVPAPFPFPVMRQMMQHSQSRAADEGLKWLRSQVLAFGAMSSIHAVDDLV